jgi:hypothetical protein
LRRFTVHLFIAGSTLLTFAACHPRPSEELALADVAVKAAQKVKADALAPDLYRKAENFYLRAKKDYNEGYYDSSRKFAEQARVMAEKAEYKSLLRQTQLKGKSPDDEAPPPDKGEGPQ